MPLTLGQNLFSQKVIRNLDRTSSELSTSFERLSSGLRINKAADDVAGLSVAEQLKVKSRIFTRAYQNVNDGISALEIAAGTLGQITSMITRMGELAEQAANGSLAYQQRKSLDQEYQALDKEIRRLADTTEFNKLSLLTGTYSSRGATQISSAAIGQGNISADGRYAFYDDGAGTIYRKDLSTNEIVTAPNPGGYASGYSIQTNSSGEYAVWFSKGVTGSHFRVHLWDVRANTVREITSNSSETGSAESVSISADGSTIAFSSNAILSSNGTQSGTSTNQSIYTYNTSSGLYTRVISDYFEGVSEIALSADGSYGATYGFTGGATDSPEAHVFRSATSTSRNLGIVAAEEYYNPGLGITNEGLFYLRTGSGYQIGGADEGVVEYNWNTQQSRNIISGFTYESPLKFKLSTDGSYITFLSTANVNALNPTGSAQIFQYDALTQATRQITNYSSDVLQEGFEISGDGNSLLILDGSNRLSMYDVSAADYRLSIETGTGTSGIVQSTLSAIDSTLRGLGNHLLTTQSSARGALENAQRSIASLGTMQGVMGSSLSRLSVAGTVTRTIADELSGARSRVIDADIAQESANLIRNQILQRATAAVLAQANQIPELALQLLE